MELDKIYERLTQKIDASKIMQNEPMNKHTSFKIGGNADFLIKATCIKDIKNVLYISKEKNIPIYILGNGSNVLVKDLGIRGIVLLINMNNLEIQKEENKAIVKVESGMKLSILSKELLKNGIAGFEFASGIPGTIGGAIRMNAGAYGTEMKNIVLNTTYIDYYGNIKTIDNKEQEFEYRKSIFSNNKYIILEAVLQLEYGNKEEIEAKINEYARYRKEKQPITFSSAGSTFKRGTDFITAKLIDECGLRGFTIGGAKISDMHAGFVTNIGNATAKDVLDLVEYIKKEVYNKFNKNIELEIEIIGE